MFIQNNKDSYKCLYNTIKAPGNVYTRQQSDNLALIKIKHNCINS